MKKTRTKIITFVSLIIVLLFAVYNIIWAVFMHMCWKPLTEPIGYNEHGECTIIAEDGYRYSAFKPSYLSFSGNLSLKKYEVMNEPSNETLCSLIIWPNFNGEYEIGVSIYGYEEDASQDNGFAFSSYGFMLDENKQPIDNLNETEKQIMEENSELIDSLYQKAYDMWGIGG